MQKKQGILRDPIKTPRPKSFGKPYTFPDNLSTAKSFRLSKLVGVISSNRGYAAYQLGNINKKLIFIRHRYKILRIRVSERILRNSEYNFNRARDLVEIDDKVYKLSRRINRLEVSAAVYESALDIFDTHLSALHKEMYRRRDKYDIG